MALYPGPVLVKYCVVLAVTVLAHAVIGAPYTVVVDIEVEILVTVLAEPL